MENTATAKEPINSDMLISEIISKYPDAVYLLMNCGMGCVSCPASQMESLTQREKVCRVVYFFTLFFIRKKS